MASNLPPGVSESMIPGNRPEDQEAEAFEEFLTEQLEAMKIELSEEQFDNLSQLISDIRNRAFSAGYQQGMADEAQANSWKDEK